MVLCRPLDFTPLVLPRGIGINDRIFFDFFTLLCIEKTACISNKWLYSRDFMLWRGSARLCGVSGVDFNVLGNLAELVRKLKVNADIAVFVNLDMVYQFNQNFAGQLFDVLIFCKSYQRGMLLVNAI